jgi:methylated-DNA-[protein]-cysteine S-methyltransferase
METNAPARTHYRLFDTAIGPCGIAWSERGLARLQLPESDRSTTERRLKKAGAGASASTQAPIEIDEAIAELQRYFSGRRSDFSSVALDLTGLGAFEQQVYAAARLLRWGETASYGELARRIGQPQAARAVGQALGQNPLPIIIPCHRILAKGHHIGGFSAYGGRLTKERLLRLEGVCIESQLLLPGFA